MTPKTRIKGFELVLFYNKTSFKVISTVVLMKYCEALFTNMFE